MIRSNYKFVFASIIALSAFCNLARAQEKAAVDHAAVLAPFLADDTLAVAYVDVTGIDPQALVAKVAAKLNLPEPIRLQIDLGAAMAKGVLDPVRQAGVGRVYVVVGMGDIQRMAGPLVIAPLSNPRGADGLQNTLRQLGVVGRPAANPDAEIRLERHASGAMMLGSKATIDRYAVLLAAPRADLVEPLNRATADGAAAAAVAAPDADSRRVVRELWPQPPAPFERLTGALVADRLKHIVLAVNLAPEMSARLSLETTDGDAAATFRELLGEAQRAAAQIPDAVAAQVTTAFAKALEVQSEDSRLVIKLPMDKTLTGIGGAVMDAVNAASESTRRRERLSNLKQILIAIANYESARKSLPPAAIRDAEGRPLLSWRVAILPFIDQKALYDQFHLNEPWDSPHNRELIKRMPEMFADPDPKLAEAVRAGKTVYQVPVGPDTIFFKNEGTKISEITDGTAQTIMLVEVLPERAVEWTKPADWEVNLQDPLDAVRRTDRNRFATGFVDAHVEMMSNDVKPDTFRALLTRAGKEEIKPEIKP